MNFVFIRHSKTDRNPQIPIACWGLTEGGVELAKELSQKDFIKSLDVLYTSFQTKALETAVLLAKPNAVPIKANDGLTEVTSFTGPFEEDFALYTKNVHDFYDDDLDRIGDGETKTEALERFNTTLESISKIENGKEFIGIVTHGNILALFSAQYRDGADPYVLHAAIEQPDVAIFNWDEKKFKIFFGEL